MPTALIFSPHLDDGAFSCGATAARLAAAGWRVVMATVFTASVPGPRGFALECQTSKGLAADVDYMRLRRAEDGAACAALGCDAVEWCRLPEAPHRGYESAAALFEPPHAGDDPAPVRAAVASLVGRHAPDVTLAPQCWGRHVDHGHVAEAAWSSGGATAWYRDTPYVLRDDPRPPPEAMAGRWAGLTEVAVDVAGGVGAKLDACAAYASQLGFQFGGEAEMRRVLGEVSHERLRATETAAVLLGEALR